MVRRLRERCATIRWNVVDTIARLHIVAVLRNASRSVRCAFVADRRWERAIYFTRTSFMIRPETFQSCTYRLPSLSQ